jgi:hypothetical protein
MFTRPGKRPFHTIIPGFVMKDGKPWEAFGVMGGGMQPQGHVQVLTNQIDFGLNVQEAGDASRWQHEGDNEPTGEKMNASGGYVEVESGIPNESVRELRNKGHDVRFRCRRLRRLSSNQSRNARWPTRLRRRQRITQRRNGSWLLSPETAKRRLGETSMSPIHRLSVSRFDLINSSALKLGEFFFRVSDVGFMRGAELKQSLLTPQIRFGKFKLGALAFCYCLLLGFDQSARATVLATSSSCFEASPDATRDSCSATTPLAWTTRALATSASHFTTFNARCSTSTFASTPILHSVPRRRHFV